MADYCGRIYLLRHASGRVYIGSTIRTLQARLVAHFTCGIVSPVATGKLYPFMKTTQREDWSIELIREVTCQSRADLEAQEYAELATYPHQELLLNTYFEAGNHPREVSVPRSRKVAETILARSAAQGTLAYRRGDYFVSWSETQRRFTVRSFGQTHKRFLAGIHRSTEDALKLAIAYVQGLTNPELAPVLVNPVKGTQQSVEHIAARRAARLRNSNRGTSTFECQRGDVTIWWDERGSRYRLRCKGKEVKIFNVSSLRTKEQCLLDAIAWADARGKENEPQQQKRDCPHATS